MEQAFTISGSMITVCVFPNESAEFLDRWVQAVRKGIPMVVPDAEVTKEAYPAEYDLYQRLGIRSVIAVSLEPRPVALLAVRNPNRYIQHTSMLRILAYVLLPRTTNRRC